MCPVYEEVLFDFSISQQVLLKCCCFYENRNFRGNDTIMMKTFFYIMPTIVAVAIFLSLGVYFGLPAQMPEIANEEAYDEEIAEALSNEYALIDKMPGAIESGYHFRKSSHQMSIGAQYTIKTSWEEIREFYGIVLKEHDWQFIKEEKVTDWGRDLGGKILRYQKGDFFISIEYFGDKARTRQTYGLSIGWGDVFSRF